MFSKLSSSKDVKAYKQHTDKTEGEPKDIDDWVFFVFRKKPCGDTNIFYKHGSGALPFTN